MLALVGHRLRRTGYALASTMGRGPDSLKFAERIDNRHSNSPSESTIDTRIPKADLPHHPEVPAKARCGMFNVPRSPGGLRDE